jgi:hypothetical protein
LYSSNISRIIKSSENEMGGTCSKPGREIHSELWLENLKERNHLEDLGVDG